MAIAVVMDFKGATLEQYDQVMHKMHLDEDDAAMPSGGVCIPEPPQISFYDVHNYMLHRDPVAA